MEDTHDAYINTNPHRLIDKWMKTSAGQDIGLDSLIRTVRNCNNAGSPQGSAVSQWSGLLMKLHRK